MLSPRILRKLVVKNKTNNNRSSERKKELGTELSRKYRVKTGRHLQMIGSNSTKENTRSSVKKNKQCNVNAK
jgi:hypothetical protein